MKLLLLQTDIAWADREANLLCATQMIASSPTTDLIVLPEMFTTGFATEPAGIAERDGDTLSWMQQQASQTGAAIVGSVAVEERGMFYNRLFFVKPDGSYATYDKRHLFSFAGEDKHYTSGTKRVVVEWAGFRILVQVCYDLRFPVFARWQGDYDMIVYVANWPAARIDVWNTLLRARAIENASWVVAVNRVGRDPYKDYPGCSQVVDFKGHVVARAASDTPEAVFVEIDRESLDTFRHKFPVLSDADRFKLNL
ncbi:MAG: amidohydrolase [Rikenellaceae bacterium]|nr:amidohydrolase [Rikenellaceae bacterium]